MSICDFPWTKRYSWNVAGWTWISRCDNIAFRPPGSSSSSAVHHVVRALRGCKIPPLGQLESKSGVWICNAFPLERAGWWWTEPLVFIYETSIDTKYILKSEWGTPCSHSPHCHQFFLILSQRESFFLRTLSLLSSRAPQQRSWVRESKICKPCTVQFPNATLQKCCGAVYVNVILTFWGFMLALGCEPVASDTKTHRKMFRI